MEIGIIDNKKRKMVDELNHLIETSHDLRFAIAFARQSGYHLIVKSLINFLNKGGDASFILGLDFHTTDPDILRELHNLSTNGQKVKLYCQRGNLEGTASYHPKLYLFQHDHNSATYIIGSSNLTKSGIKDNLEVNIKVKSTIYEDSFSDVSDIFNQLKLSKTRFIPDDIYIEKYAELYTASKKNDVRKTQAFKELLEIEKKLPKPQYEKSDLTGWKKLVYDHLPNNKFSTSDIYRYKDLFSQYYPDNQNIEAKIRQQLQYLEKLGMLKKNTRNSWEKI